MTSKILATTKSGYMKRKKIKLNERRAYRRI